jgi:phospholipid/cholesterol/gamma-HCH transport system substrate-binding protein
VKIRREVKIGVVVLVAICLLFFGLNYLKGINVFTHTKKVYAVYTNTSGLVPSNFVLVNGFQVGEVQHIDLRPDASGRIIVTMLITNNQVKIPKNSIAHIISADLLGSKAIQIDLGTGTSYADEGDTLAAVTDKSFKDEVDEELSPLKKKTENLIESIDSTLTIVQSVFDKNTRSNLSKSIESITISLKHFESTSASVDTLMSNQKSRVSDILAKVDDIATALAKNSKQLGNAINNLSSITDTIAKSKLKETISNADSALYYVSKSFEKINKGQGSLGLLVNDTTLYRRLSSSSASLNALLEDMKAHPKRYVHFSVFGGGKKE